MSMQPLEIIDASLREYIEESIIPQYDTFDAAHRRDHADSVIVRSLHLAQHYDVDVEMVYTIAAYHDIGLKDGRDTHHTMSKEAMLKDKMLTKWFTTEQIAIMADAVEDHRASSKSAPRTIYGAIVAEADRLIVPQTIIRRTVQYTLHHQPELNKEEGYQRMVEHMHEKYYYGGYLKLWIAESDNAQRLEELRQIIANPDVLRSTYEVIYAEETAERQQLK